MQSTLLSSHLYQKVTFFLSCHRKFHMNWTCLKRQFFLCPKGDLWIQVWLDFKFSTNQKPWWSSWKSGKVNGHNFRRGPFQEYQSRLVQFGPMVLEKIKTKKVNWRQMPSDEKKATWVFGSGELKYCSALTLN